MITRNSTPRCYDHLSHSSPPRTQAGGEHPGTQEAQHCAPGDQNKEVTSLKRRPELGEDSHTDVNHRAPEMCHGGHGPKVPAAAKRAIITCKALERQVEAQELREGDPREGAETGECRTPAGRKKNRGGNRGFRGAGGPTKPHFTQSRQNRDEESVC
ncbi:hypothetical protein H1C71_003748 [Ictidomys tridecemlineatus]|nr:hypothetical protein H1C71_003748 [Ictidomys tridecemlineatus]